MGEGELTALPARETRYDSIERAARAGLQRRASDALDGGCGVHGEHLARFFLAAAPGSCRGGGRVESGRVDHDLIARLEAALAATGNGDQQASRRVRLLSRLAVALYFTPAVDRRAALADEAVTRARQLEDPGVLVAALAVRHIALWGPDSLEARLDDVDELLRLARALDDRALLLEGRTRRIADLLELGEFTVACAEIESYAQAAEKFRRPLYRWHAEQFHVLRALAEGRLAEAERRAGEAVRLGRRAGAAGAEKVHAAQMFLLLRDQGRLAEIEDRFLCLVDAHPALSPWRIAGLLLHLEAGRAGQARREFAAQAAGGYADIPRDGDWLVTMALLAEACASLGDEGTAGQLYALLRPYAMRIVVLASGVACLGPVAHYLGLLATTASRWEEAAASFELGLDICERAGARAWQARTRHAYGSMLLARGRPADRPRADQLLQAARTAYAELCMAGPAARLPAARAGGR